MRAAVIKTDTQWMSLMQSSVVLNRNVVLQNLGDIHPPGKITFPKTKRLWVEGCDKNFVFYWLSPDRFPSLEKLYLASHPCEPLVLMLWTDYYNGKFFLLEDYQGYHRRWTDSDPEINLISWDYYVKSRPTQTEEIEL